MSWRLDFGDWAIVVIVTLIALAGAVVWFKHKVLDNAQAQQDARRMLWRSGLDANRPFTRRERLAIGLGLFRVSQKPETGVQHAQPDHANGRGAGREAA